MFSVLLTHFHISASSHMNLSLVSLSSLSFTHPSDVSATRIARVDGEVSVRQHVDRRVPVLLALRDAAPNLLPRCRLLAKRGIAIAIIAIRMMVMSHSSCFLCIYVDLLSAGVTPVLAARASRAHTGAVRPALLEGKCLCCVLNPRVGQLLPLLLLSPQPCNPEPDETQRL